MNGIAVITNNGCRQLFTPAKAQDVVSRGWGRTADALNQRALEAYVAGLKSADAAEDATIARAKTPAKKKAR